MKSTFFQKPVMVLVGLGFPRKIESAMEAYQLLSDMRLTTSRAAQKVAMQACKAAVDGKIDPETARSAFVAFARRSAMLLSKSTDLEAGRAVDLLVRDARVRRAKARCEDVRPDDLKPISA